MSGNIYDDLANSDFVNPGQFKAQMKALAEIEDTERQPERRLQDTDHQEATRVANAELPGPMYGRADPEFRVGNSSEEFKMRMLALESVKRQNMMKEYNPMDEENEQSLPFRSYKVQDEAGAARERAKGSMPRAAYEEDERERQRRGMAHSTAQDGDEEAVGHGGELKELRLEQLQKEASEERSRFQMQTRLRQSIPENDFLDQEDGGHRMNEAEDETPYDLAVKKRNQMIFDDNIQLSDRQHEEPRNHNIHDAGDPGDDYGMMDSQENQEMMRRQALEDKEVKDGGTSQFTLNKYDSRPDLRKKVSENADDYDAQVQTAHFKKQVGPPHSAKDGASNSERARTNTEQTQRTRGGDQSALGISDPRQGHLIDQRGIQASSQFQDDYRDEYQDSEKRKKQIVSKYAHILESQHDQKEKENEDTGQFGDKEAAGWKNQESDIDARLRQLKNIQTDQFKTEELVESKLVASPTIRTKGDNESDKINQLLAQLQAPMTMEHFDSYQQPRPMMGITETSSQREDYNMNQLELERAHRQMQQSIKQMKLITQGAPSSVDQFSAAQDDQGSLNGQKYGAFGFNGQNSIYELANKVGHQLSSSNLQSITHTDNDNDFQKLLQAEGSLGSGRYQMMDQKFKGAADHERESGAYPGAMTDTTGMINLACSDKPMQPQTAAQPSTSTNSNFDQLKLLMQRHSDKSNREEEAVGQRNNENFNGKNIPYEVDAQPVGGRPSHLGGESQFVQVASEQSQPANPAAERPSHQQPAPMKQMSLAQRANQAKMAAQQRQQQLLENAPQTMTYDPPSLNPSTASGFMIDYNQQPHQQQPANELQFNQHYRQRFDPAQLNQPRQYGAPQNFNAVPQQFQNQHQYGYQAPPQQQRPQNYHFQQQQQLVQAPDPSHLQQHHQAPQAVDFSTTNRNTKAEKRKALMAQFDDIPIHQLHKAEGYQIRNIDDESEDGARAVREGASDGLDRGQQDEDLRNMSLKDRAFDPKWKVRLNAFREINQLFVDYQGPNRELQKEEELYGDPENPFEVYGPIIQEMIKDNNLTARYEGLNCLYSFVKYGTDVRSVSNTCLAFLLDKVQLNKPNFRDVTQRVLLMMMQKKQHILPEVLKRFTSKTQIQLSFCIGLVNQAFQERALQVQDSNMKLVFKYTHDLLGHQNKEIRDQSLQLITFVYQHCEDDLNSFCANVKTLRPVQLKELRETLSGVEKSKDSEFLVRLFDKVSAYEGRRDGAAQGDKSPHGRSKSIGSDKGHQQPGGDDQDGDEPNGQQEIDLLTLLPANFSEIPYITQINVKRKALEQFNQELEKLWKKQEAVMEQFRAESAHPDEDDTCPCLVKLNKDYSQIYNISTHMLEDANLLVFIEAIRSIEFLAHLLGSSMKQVKAKAFLTLLADKYKEVKTAVLTQLEKTFDALFENRCLSPQMFFDTLLNQIAASHKNPRVRQMVLDRVELIIEKNYLNAATGETKNASQLFNTFKQVKDKLKQIVLKDTNAQVRDAGVSLVGLFKIILQVAECDLLVSEVINQLPKQRQTQIQQRVEMFQQLRREGGADGAGGNQGGAISARFFTSGDDQSRQQTRSRSRGRSGRSAARGKSAKSSEKYAKPRHSDVSQYEETHSPSSKQAAGSDQALLFQTKKAQSNVSSKFQATLSDVILTIKNIGQENDRLRPSQIIDNLDQALNELAEGEGINECKSPIVSCIFWLFSNCPAKVNFLEHDRQQATKAVLNFFKKLYCYDRSVSNAPLTQDGQSSLELYQAVSSLLICFALLHRDSSSHKTISQILNILMIATSESNILISTYLSTLKQVFTKYDPCPRQIANSRAIIASLTIYFVADKMADMVKRAQDLGQELQRSHFEEFRAIVVAAMEGPGRWGQAQFTEEEKPIMVQAVVYLQEQIMKVFGAGIDQKKMFEAGNGTTEEEYMQNTSQFAGHVEEQQPVERRPRYLEVIDEIKSNFEKGLLKLKELVIDEQSGRVAPTPFEEKEQIVALLIKITTQGYKNPTEQYKQAYSLKALMWLKEEFIGLQETFQLTFSIMNPYAFARFEERDHSIEKYLLDFWTKDLSLRDCIDRIQQTCKISMIDSESTFFYLFQWLLEKRIFAEDQNDATSWALEDFRKAAPMIANILVKGKTSEEQRMRASTILKFIDVCVDRFGARKFRDFMEIQLIHDNDACLQFLDIFNEKYHNELPRGEDRDASEGYLVIQNDNLNPVSSQSNRNAAGAAIRETTNTDSKESLGEPYLSVHSATGANPSLQQSFNQVTDRSQLLQEMRDRRKVSAQNAKTTEEEQDFQDTLAREKQKFEEIMKKLENYKGAGRQASARPGTEELPPTQTPDGLRPVTTEPSADGKKFEFGENRQASTAKNKADDGVGASKVNEGQQRTGSARYSNRYEQHWEHQRPTTNQDGSTSLQDFNDEEDFKLSVDHPQSVAMMGAAKALSQKSLNVSRPVAEGDRFMEERIKMQQVGHRSSKTSVTMGEGLKSNLQPELTLEKGKATLDANDSVMEELQTVSQQQLQESRQKIRQSVQFQEEKLQRLESSQIKVRQFKIELETLHEEKRKLEIEKQQLLSEQNRETEEWKERHRDMMAKNDEITSSLAEANQQYLRQVSDNEKLTNQILLLQDEHKRFLGRYRELEQKLIDSENLVEEQKIKLKEESLKASDPAHSPALRDSEGRGNVHDSQVVEEASLSKIEEVFDQKEMMRYGEDNLGAAGVKKIQELLLDSEGANQRNLAKPMIFHYQKMKNKLDRMQMLAALKLSLENEDILFAISIETYKSLLNFLLQVFSFEKELIERESLDPQHERQTQNELTQESQRLVSKLLNSKEFTHSLICLIQLLKNDAMPTDFSTNLSIQQRHYLRVIMRCTSRITKALHSENPDLIRAFDVLIEMQKLFVKHPPENLRQDLPCLQDFDYVYRGLKEVSDKLIELQPQKCRSFLDFCLQDQSARASTSSNITSKPSAFLNYIMQMLQK